MSDTPRTDAWQRAYVFSTDKPTGAGTAYADAFFDCLKWANQLESELTTCQEQLKTAQEHLSESSLEIAWWKRTSKDAEEKLQSANEQLAKLPLNWQELKARCDRYERAEAELPEEPALSESIDDPDGCGDVVAREDYNDLRTFAIAQVVARRDTEKALIYAVEHQGHHRPEHQVAIDAALAAEGEMK